MKEKEKNKRKKRRKRNKSEKRRKRRGGATQNLFLKIVCTGVLSSFSRVQLFVTCSPLGSSVHGIL